jgi:hypothetical protein
MRRVLVKSRVRSCAEEKGASNKRQRQLKQSSVGNAAGAVSAMSTPAGKPVNPIGPFAHVSHETHERAGSEYHPVESHNEAIRSPYTPTRARARAERHTEENDHDPLRSPYAPKKARTQPAARPDVAVREDVVPPVPLRGPKRLRGHPERDAVDANESNLFSHDPDSDTLHPAAHPNSQQREQPAAAGRDRGIRDLKRLVATLCWIQREEAAARIPRAAQLPAVPGLAPADARDRRCGEMFDNGFRSPRSLEPERMGPPPAMSSRRRKLGASLIILIASIFSAPIGYYFSTGGWSPSSQAPSGPQMALVTPRTNALPSSIAQQELPRTMARDDDHGMLAEGEIASQRPGSQSRRSSEGDTVAMVQPSATGAQAPPSSKAIRVLDPEVIKLLMKQGEQFIAAGDVVTARIVFQRAAEAGNANAAMALGATYDPTVLAKLGVVGTSADVEKTRSWYQTAEKLGSPEARRRLDVLADR